MVVYELYDGLPTFGKWVETSNAGGSELLVETLVVEELHAGEHAKSRMHLETNYIINIYIITCPARPTGPLHKSRRRIRTKGSTKALS